MKLAAIILTYNESKHITDCIESLRFADQIIVFDSHSRDDTPERAAAAGAMVIQHPFEDYPSQRNAALEAAAAMGEARPDWVLFVDADERVPRALALEVREKITFPDYAGFRIPRDNFIFGKLTRGGGWYPDYQTRLLRVGAAHYDPEKRVHEVVICDGNVSTMNAALVHFNYEDVEQFHQKQRRYSAYDAQVLFEAGVRPKPRNYVLQPLRQFWWRFVTLRGFIDGLHGLRLALLMAWYELRKYRLLRDKWREADYDAANGGQSM